MITILHLSDLHFKREKDDNYPVFRQETGRKMIAVIKKHLTSNPQLDFVVITGDIAYDGKDYSEAENFFKKLKASLPPEVIFLPVPGNHDVDRSQVDEFLSLYEIIKKDQIERFLTNEKKIKEAVNNKFAYFRRFAAKLNPRLYQSETEFFWVQDFEEQQVSFLGLNSAWASEGDQDQMRIALGYPQVVKALDLSRMPCRIILMHHPPHDWLESRDMGRCRKEIVKKCQLVLYGHAHSDQALIYQDPVSAGLYLGANASYTDDKAGFIGYQFLRVELSKPAAVRVTVWPYIYEERSQEFQPDRNRYEKAQEGREYFELPPSRATKTGIGNELPLPIPPEYQDWAREFHSTISFDQLAKKGEAVPVQLISIYIPLETNNPFHQPEQEKLAADKKDNLSQTDEVAVAGEAKEPVAIDIEKLLGRVDRLVLRGNAGMGKTTLIKHLVYTITEGSADPAIRGYLPVMVLLKDLWLIYNEALNQPYQKKIVFEELLQVYLEKVKCPLRQEVINNYLLRDKALFLFDGLDEIPEGLRDSLVNLIVEFYFKHKKNRYLFTGRPHGINGKVIEFFGDCLYEINYLDQPKIDAFIRKWFRAVSGQAIGLANVTADEMLSDIGHHEHIAVFTQNPLLLAAVCVLYAAGKRIPEQRSDLYDRIVENLLWRRFHDPAHPDHENLITAYLMSLAFLMQSQNRRTIEENEAKQVFKEIFSNTDKEGAAAYLCRINRLFTEIEPNCGLLNRLNSGEIEFSHLTFQEFLAAKYMVNMDRDYQEFMEQEWWEETLILYLGYINQNMRKRSNDIIADILNTKTSNEKSRNRLRLLGAKALRDFQAIKRDEAVIGLAREKLVQLVNSDAGLKERFEAGEILGVFGDPRLEAENFILVKGGGFIRGSKDDDNSKPVKEIEVSDFLIGKYPVTNQDFSRFIEAGGYQTQKWWSKEGWQWREKEEIREPSLRHDRKWNGPNFPVVGVSWYEAAAYTKWLSAETGQAYRLPTEAEWEKAARGTGGRKYPWGNQWEKEYCNSYETRMGRTSPVGIFPNGASPYGCLDMAGNVWEWCADWYDKGYYAKSPTKNPIGPDSGSSRVIRGGSWDDGAEYCVAASLNFGWPEGRDDNLGFRLVRSYH